jgi:GTP-binding protein
VILHLIDVGNPYAAEKPAEAYAIIRGELEKYSRALADKPELIAANKIDLTGGEDKARELAAAIGKPVVPVSAVSGRGVPGLAEQLWSLIQANAAGSPVAA